MAEDIKKKIAELEAKRAKRKASADEARDVQRLKDLEELDKLEIEHGDGIVSALDTPSFVEGLPTLVVVKAPAPDYMKRFRQQVRKASKSVEAIGNAQDMLAASCVAYPDTGTYERMKETWSALHDSVGVEAIRLGQAEGKD